MLTSYKKPLAAAFLAVVYCINTADGVHISI